MNRNRVLVIGLDGATFDIIRPMVEAGRLPVIAKLMNEGSWGELRSTVMPVTPPAWASFMTGKNPGKHGVYGFYAHTDNSYNTTMVTGLSIKSKKIWNYLKDKKVGLIDIPMTYPPEDINGCMISGWPVPADESIFTHPPELHTEIIGQIGEYMIDKTFTDLPRVNPIDTLRNLYRYTEERTDASLYLLKKKGPFDFFMVVFRGTDFIQHEAFKFHDEIYCKANPEISKKFKDVIYQFYEKIDSMVAELVEAMGDDATVIIMSDHGAGPMEKRFYINRWLKSEGFLSLKEGASPRGIGLGRKPLSDIVQRGGYSSLNHVIPSFLKRLRVPYPKPYAKHPATLIDWGKTKAFANLTWTDGIMRINLKGREPEGIVEQRDYNKVSEEIIERLMGLVDPETGSPVVQQAYKRGDVYKGPYLEDAPDILILTNKTSYVFSPALDDGPVLERPENPAPAPHRMEGVFIVNGPDIKGGQVLSGLNITDIAPTILYLMGKQIPDSMDGRVVTEAISGDLLAKEPPVFYKEEGEGALETIAQEFSAEEKKRMEDALRALGYME